MNRTLQIHVTFCNYHCLTQNDFYSTSSCLSLCDQIVVSLILLILPSLELEPNDILMSDSQWQIVLSSMKALFVVTATEQIVNDRNHIIKAIQAHFWFIGFCEPLGMLKETLKTWHVLRFLAWCTRKTAQKSRTHAGYRAAAEDYPAFRERLVRPSCMLWGFGKQTYWVKGLKVGTNLFNFMC